MTNDPLTPSGTSVDGNFRLVFGWVAALTVLFFIGAVGIAILNRGNATDDGLKSLAEKLTSLANIGFGAMVGLLGGKATK